MTVRIPPYKANFFLAEHVPDLSYFNPNIALYCSRSVFGASFHHRVLNVIGRGWRTLTTWDIKPALDSFGKAFESGVKAIEGIPGMLVHQAGVIIGALLSTVITLWFCFIALGSHLKLWHYPDRVYYRTHNWSDLFSARRPGDSGCLHGRYLCYLCHSLSPGRFSGYFFG